MNEVIFFYSPNFDEEPKLVQGDNLLLEHKKMKSNGNRN